MENIPKIRYIYKRIDRVKGKPDLNKELVVTLEKGYIIHY